MAYQLLTLKIPGNYKILKVLGQGVYGQVLQCLKQDTKEIVAVKVLKKEHSDCSKMREVVILERLQCLDPDKSNIIRYHESLHRNNQTFIVFEKLDMNLYDYLCKTRAPLPLHGIRTIIKGLATALNALKSIGLIHSDLKLDNVMLVDHRKQPFRAKLIDFGLTLGISEARPGIDIQALWNRAPEIILGLPFTEAIDIWSLGAVMAELLLGFPLFPGRTNYDVLRFITDLLGEPPKKLLNSGINTDLFYNGSRKYLLFRHWTLKAPWEFYDETGIRAVETRRHRFCSLEELKTVCLQAHAACRGSHQDNSTYAADLSACVELLKEMLEMDPRKRITPSQILAHPFITSDHDLTSSSKNETATDETSPADGDTSNTTEASANDSLKKLPSTVIMVWPAKMSMQKEGATNQSSVISPQSVENDMTSGPDTVNEGDLILESISDSETLFESITDCVETSLEPGQGCRNKNTSLSIPWASPNSRVEAPDISNQASVSITSLHSSEVSETKKKKKKRGNGRFFSPLKRKFCSCYHVSDDVDE